MIEILKFQNTLKLSIKLQSSDTIKVDLCDSYHIVD
jgi:hypothetical protein